MRRGNNYSGPRWAFAPKQQPPKRPLKPAPGPPPLVLSGSSRRRPKSDAKPTTGQAA